MIIPKKQRIEVYQYLFKEGVIVAKKDTQLKSHPEITGVPNLSVMLLMKGFASKGLVRENFAWRHFYWYLTNEGINYLREYLHLPQTIVPATLLKTARSVRPDQPPRRNFGDRPRREGGFERRREYRQGGEDEEKGNSAPVDYKPSYGGDDNQGEQRQSRGRGFASGRGKPVDFSGENKPAGRGVRQE
ncbi:ribosomal protein S10 [Acrasis kona]|uniref:Ribosomal protein S10 n=1 Tax=Acrasis kona TaxID=1008807 RepID=A0AAW2YYF2_9EUKA